MEKAQYDTALFPFLSGSKLFEWDGTFLLPEHILGSQAFHHVGLQGEFGSWSM
jgi:hypothetical protein